MTTMVWTYAVYLLLCVAVTIWVAETLRHRGKVFATDGRNENTDLIDAFTHLLVVGFYLINLGAICLALKYGGKAIDIQTAVEILSTKVGLILLALGVMHFAIVAVFSKARKDAEFDRRRKLAGVD
jgi:hypothetical protein